MADKEERICICKLEGNATDSVCGGSISRTEAIRRIARVYGCGHKAEAALNALLEGVIKKKNNTVYELYTYNNGEKVTIGYSENMTDEKELEIKYK